MAVCLFCKGFSGVHGAGCPFLIDSKDRTSQLSEGEYTLFAQRAREMLYEEDASKPALTLMLTETVIIGLMKLIRDMMLPPGDAKDPSTTSLRAMAQLAVDGEKFLGGLQKAMLAAGAKSAKVEFDDDENEEEDVAPVFALKRPKALPAAKDGSGESGKPGKPGKKGKG